MRLETGLRTHVCGAVDESLGVGLTHELVADALVGLDDGLESRTLGVIASDGLAAQAQAGPEDEGGRDGHDRKGTHAQGRTTVLWLWLWLWLSRLRRRCHSRRGGHVARGRSVSDASRCAR